MFTIEQIKQAHAKVKSGADFPNYVKDMKALGVQRYEHYLENGRTQYYGADGYQVAGPAKYTALNISNESSTEALQQALAIHQQGKTDYLTFSREALEAGVEKWIVDLVGMTCTYYDKKGNLMVLEEIPAA